MLAGIAKLAAESPLLESKRDVEYFELPSRSVLNRVPNMQYFAWSINPYRGCEFGCKYCYARYTHEYMELAPEAFEDRIYAKLDVAALLRRDLPKVKPDESIAIGTATDPYQPAERRFGRTRAILEVFERERGRSLSITTKSDLVARDAELLRSISRGNQVHVNITITTVDVALARAVEPRAPRPDLRLRALETLTAAGVRAGVSAAPLLPLINDSEPSLDALACAAARAGASHMFANVLFLMPSAQKVFFPFLEKNFPHLLRRYRARYERDPYLRGAYRDDIRERFERVRARYGLGSSPAPYQPELWSPPEQLELFPLS